MKACETKIPKADPNPAKTTPFDNIEDDVIGVGKARIDGDKYILDGIDEDYDPIDGARLVVFSVGVSAVAILGLIVAAIIKIIH